MIPKKAILVASVIVCAAALCVFVLTFLVERIPAPDMTRSRIGGFEYRLHDYYAVNHRLPASLSDIPVEANKDNEVVDGWGRPIQYSSNGTTVTLLSLGKDGRRGGTGEDADIVDTFDVVKEPEFNF